MPVSLRIGEVARPQGFTIKAVAERAGVAYNTAHALSTGRATRIDLDTLDRILYGTFGGVGDIFVRHPAPESSDPEDLRGDGYDRERDRATSPPDRRGTDRV